MKYISALIVSLLVAVSFASPASIYIDDSRFDYSLDSLTTEADSYTGYSTTYDYDSEENIAIDVPVYVYFENPTVDGALRIHFATEDTFSTDTPVMFVSVPDDSDGLGDISELDISANKTEDISIAVADMNLNEVLDCYLTKFEELGYQVSQLENNNYSITLLNSTYLIDFVEGVGSVTVSINAA